MISEYYSREHSLFKVQAVQQQCVKATKYKGVFLRVQTLGYNVDKGNLNLHIERINE
jgi:hypothetical protein